MSDLVNMTWENARFEVPAEIVASSIIMPALRDLKAIIVLHQEALNTPARTKALRNPGNSVKKPEIGAIILGVAFAENPCKNREIPANPRRNRPSRPERPERPAAVPVSAGQKKSRTSCAEARPVALSPLDITVSTWNHKIRQQSACVLSPLDITVSTG